MYGVFSNALSILAMVGCILLLGWLVGSGDAQGQDARPEEVPPPEGVRTPSWGPFEGR
jgi:hypothetical protein